MPPWELDFTGRSGTIDNKPVLIQEQLTEVTDHKFGQRHVLALGRTRDNGQEIMLKIRYDLHPHHFDLGDLKVNAKMAMYDFFHEIRMIQAVAAIGHGPPYITHISQTEGPSMPYPPCDTDFIVMRRVPGRNLDDIYDNLSDEQLESIRLQLARILEHLRREGFLLTEQHPSLLQYDERNDKLYLVDCTFMTFTDPSGPNSCVIDRDSSFVAAFDIWRRDTPGILGSNHPTQAHTPKVPAQSAGPSFPGTYPR